jgi:phosphohistidine phosphatase
MKNLLLIRHAKATHETGFVDFERPLKPSGLRDAALMATRLKEHSVVPQIIISSPALRTIATANVFSEHLSLPQPLTDKNIYDASLDTLINVVNELSGEHSFIGIVGHNPGISQLLHYLTNEIRDMETCATVLVSFNVKEWSAIGKSSGNIAYYSFPGEE